MKKIISTILSVAIAALLVTGCEKKVSASGDGTVDIVYTNDIHSYVGNVAVIENEETKEKETVAGLRISKLSGYVKQLKADGKSVLLVDAGDHVQGNSYGAIDSGESIISIMNAAGFDLSTPGNHEFDYSFTQFQKLQKMSKFPYISCNFKTASGSNVFKPVKIIKAGNKKIAFVGITTPTTLMTTTPTYFQDNKGKFIYNIEGLSNPETLYKSVQMAIDSVKNKADVVIALGHVGVGIDEKKMGISSINIIQNTSGLNAFIDGHSHTRVEGITLKDKDGNDVLLTQTGSYLDAAGHMTVAADNSISTKLISSFETTDETVAELEAKLLEKVQAQLSKKVAETEVELTVNNPERNDQRLIRSREMNIGDFTADSVYWYFNEKINLKCDAAFVNGGGIRTSIEKGDITLENVKNVHPFGNMICLIKVTGQQIKDALEMGTTEIGNWDSEWDCPAENGAFMHVAGLRYTIDAFVKSSVKLNEKLQFNGVDGNYRVKKIEIYNKETGYYDPIDLSKTYTLAGNNYILRNGGNGLIMFSECENVLDFAGQDGDILSEYCKSFKAENDYPVIKTSNSPLNKYRGYQLNYENPFGAGRINIRF